MKLQFVMIKAATRLLVSYKDANAHVVLRVSLPVTNKQAFLIPKNKSCPPPIIYGQNLFIYIFIYNITNLIHIDRNTEKQKVNKNWSNKILITVFKIELAIIIGSNTFLHSLIRNPIALSNKSVCAHILICLPRLENWEQLRSVIACSTGVFRCACVRFDPGGGGSRFES